MLQERVHHVGLLLLAIIMKMVLFLIQSFQVVVIKIIMIVAIIANLNFKYMNICLLPTNHLPHNLATITDQIIIDEVVFTIFIIQVLAIKTIVASIIIVMEDTIRSPLNT